MIWTCWTWWTRWTWEPGSIWDHLNKSYFISRILQQTVSLFKIKHNVKFIFGAVITTNEVHFHQDLHFKRQIPELTFTKSEIFAAKLTEWFCTTTLWGTFGKSHSHIFSAWVQQLNSCVIRAGDWLYNCVVVEEEFIENGSVRVIGWSSGSCRHDASPPAAFESLSQSPNILSRHI